MTYVDWLAADVLLREAGVELVIFFYLRCYLQNSQGDGQWEARSDG
jgi:hypothetical protein